MAEIAAGAIIAEEVVSTTVQGVAATYAVAKPTMPLKATFNQIATASDDQTRQSLARSEHTISVVGNKAYIFGGRTANGQIAGPEIHSIALGPSEKLDYEYALIPAIPDLKDGKVPNPRTKHAACAFNVCVAVFGGCDESGKHVDDGATIWLYNTAKSAWEFLEAESQDVPSKRTNAKLFNKSNNLILYGGSDVQGNPLSDVWEYSYSNNTWTSHPEAPVSTPNAALADNTLYLISSASNISSEVHILPLSSSSSSSSSPAWTTHSFPTNPLTPGPRPRSNAGLLPISTGYGRNYLLYFFGSRQVDPSSTASSTLDPTTTTDPTMWGDMWTFQVASSSSEIKPTLSLSEAIKPARIKDAIREKLGYDSGERVWAEVEVLPPSEKTLERLGTDGKVHPGPRAEFGCDVLDGGKGVVFWGGVNAKGEKEGDGWVVLLE